MARSDGGWVWVDSPHWQEHNLPNLGASPSESWIVRAVAMPRTTVFLVAVSVLLLRAVPGTQTEISGTARCSNPYPQHVIPVGDRPNHSFAISQIKCSWVKSFEIAGTNAKDSVSTEFADISSNSSHIRGYHVGTMTNGDNYYVRYEGSATLRDEALESSEGTWSFIGGTGKLKSVEGQGTYRCRAAGEGTTCDIEGAYKLPMPLVQRVSGQEGTHSCADIPTRKLTQQERKQIIKERRKIKCAKAHGSIFNRIRKDVKELARIFLKLGYTSQPADEVDSYVLLLKEQNEEFCSFYKNTPEVSEQTWICIKENLLDYQREFARMRHQYEQGLRARPPLVGQLKGEKEIWRMRLINNLTADLWRLGEKAQELGTTMESIREKVPEISEKEEKRTRN